MVTSKLALALIGVAGFVLGAVLLYVLWGGFAGMYAARRAQIFGEPARDIFVSASIALAIVPLIGVAAWLILVQARASSPLRRGLYAWGWSIVAAVPAFFVTIGTSMIVPTPTWVNSFYVVVALYAIACSAIWVRTARVSLRPRATAAHPRLEDIE